MEPDIFNKFILLSDDEKAALARRGIRTGNYITKGSYGAVFDGTYFNTKIAIKKINMHRAEVATVLMEMLVLKKIRHPNVVRLIDFFLIDINQFRKLLIFMEFLDIDLRKPLFYESPFPEGRVAKFYSQFGSGLAFMHNRGFAHRDLKPSNILLNADYSVAKLADFGLSMQGYDIYTGESIMVNGWRGSGPYMAPEVMYWRASFQIPTYFKMPPVYCPFLADIWSMGIITFEMFYGYDVFPFEINFKSPKVDWKDACEKIIKVQDNLKEQFNLRRRKLSDTAKYFVARHLQLLQKPRPNMDELLEDMWIVSNTEHMMEM